MIDRFGQSPEATAFGVNAVRVVNLGSDCEFALAQFFTLGDKFLRVACL